MKFGIIAAGWLLGVLAAVPARAADQPKAKDAPLYEISLDLQVFRGFYLLKLSDEQLKAVAKFAKETAEPERKRNTQKASDEARRVLTDLRAALLDGSDEDKIGDLEEELDGILEKEKPQLDDGFDVTKAARKRTADVIKSLKAEQLTDYYSSVEDDIQDPLEQLTKALEDVRSIERGEWRDKRDEIADDLTWSVIGVDAEKSEKFNDKVIALLSTARSLTDAEFKAKKDGLEKEAKTLIGNVGADDLKRHHAEHTIADMLSNPRLAAAIKTKVK